jgi:tetratricopeptide (TPR) repeat protein
MRHVVFAAVFLLASQVAFAQRCHLTATRSSPCQKELAAAVPQPDLRQVDWPVTGNEEARRFFSQGMTQYYGFNTEEALRNFQGAAKADPSMAMAAWGIALAAGPNLNFLDMDKGCYELAQTKSKLAVELAKKQPSITALEQALIDALTLRYPPLPPQPLSEKELAALQDKAMHAYSDALGANWEKFKEFRGNANYGALYAESLMNLHAWDLYDKNHQPTSPDTDKVLSVLKTAMDVDKKAVGANHYYIHAVEAGPEPRIGEESANLFRTRVEASGHLVHMSSHIYLLMGEYLSAVDSNVHAAAVDVGQYGVACRGTFEEYNANNKCPQLYYGHYLSHNYFFGSVAATFSGQSERAVKMACDTRAHAERFVANEPGLQWYMTTPLRTLVVDRNWDAILKYPEPPAECYSQSTEQNGCHTLRSIWHWARGMAFATRGNTAVAEQELTAMVSEMEKIKPPTPVTWGNNSAAAVLGVAQPILQARISWAAQDSAAAIKFLKTAVANEDQLRYDEPPTWFTPAREALGGAYLQAGGYDDALTTFLQDLVRHPKSGRALYGVLQARARIIRPPQSRSQFEEAKKAYCDVWKNADYTMTNADLWPSLSGTNPDPGITCEQAPRPTLPSQCACTPEFTCPMAGGS